MAIKPLNSVGPHQLEAIQNQTKKAHSGNLLHGSTPSGTGLGGPPSNVSGNLSQTSGKSGKKKLTALEKRSMFLGQSKQMMSTPNQNVQSGFKSGGLSSNQSSGNFGQINGGLKGGASASVSVGGPNIAKSERLREHLPFQSIIEQQDTASSNSS